MHNSVCLKRRQIRASSRYARQVTPRRAQTRATIVLRKIDAAGRPVRQVELSDQHAQVVVDRERKRGLEIYDLRDWR
jgi:hypothetical protein